MKNLLKVLVTIIVVSSLFHSCKKDKDECDGKDIYCPGMPKEIKSAFYMPNKGDTIWYVNDRGGVVRFIINRIAESQGYISPCLTHEIIGGWTSGGTYYFADPCVLPTLYYQSNNRNGNELKVEFKFNPDNPHEIGVHYKFLGHEHGFQPGNDLDSGETILPLFSVGGKNYKDVRVYEEEPIPTDKQWLVWKSYFNNENGLIAFHDLKTNSLFYLK